MTSNLIPDLFHILKSHFGDAVIQSHLSTDLLNIEIQPESVKEILLFLKKHPDYDVNFLTLLGAVHYPEQENRNFAIVYHLHSWSKNIRFRIKAFLPETNPTIDSVVSIYPCANWMERETYDFYGIHFNDHPNLKRILNEDDMDYFPMRKEYALEDQSREDKDDRYFGRTQHNR
jgi:NADH-quinone oxidoreductase subunit C